MANKRLRSNEQEGQKGQAAGNQQPTCEDVTPPGRLLSEAEKQHYEADRKQPKSNLELINVQAPGNELEIKGRHIPGESSSQHGPTQPFVPAMRALLQQADEQPGDEEGQFHGGKSQAEHDGGLWCGCLWN
jgi:hypothetical protein